MGHNTTGFFDSKDLSSRTLASCRALSAGRPGAYRSTSVRATRWPPFFDRGRTTSTFTRYPIRSCRVSPSGGRRPAFRTKSNSHAARFPSCELLTNANRRRPTSPGRRRRALGGDQRLKRPTLGGMTATRRAARPLSRAFGLKPITHPPSSPQFQASLFPK
jgi:hypothetical protein